jgi:hypothetical protein
MEKKYKRTPDIYIIVLIVGLVVVIDSFRIQNFVWLYDGIKFLVALLVALYGLWGLLMPYATISDGKLRINATVLRTREFDVDDTRVEFDERQDVIEISDHKKTQLVKTRNIRSQDRARFKNDLNQLSKESVDQDYSYE